MRYKLILSHIKYRYVCLLALLLLLSVPGFGQKTNENACSCTLPIHLSGQIPSAVCAGDNFTFTVGYDQNNSLVIIPPESEPTTQPLIIPNGLPCDGNEEDISEDECTITSHFCSGYSGTIRSGKDIQYVRLNIEHGQAGDLLIRLKCPPSDPPHSVTLLKVGIDPGQLTGCAQFINSTNLNENDEYWHTLGISNCIDNNPCAFDVCPPEEGWNYCWSNLDNNNPKLYESSPEDWSFDPSEVGSVLSYYQPDESFDALTGCSLSGEWTIEIMDASNNEYHGYLHDWEIVFAQTPSEQGGVDSAAVLTSTGQPDPRFEYHSTDTSFTYTASTDITQPTEIIRILRLFDACGCCYDTTIRFTITPLTEYDHGDTNLCLCDRAPIALRATCGGENDQLSQGFSFINRNGDHGALPQEGGPGTREVDSFPEYASALSQFPNRAKVFPAGGKVKLGTSKIIGSMTSIPMILQNPFDVIVRAKGWGTADTSSHLPKKTKINVIVDKGQDTQQIQSFESSPLYYWPGNDAYRDYTMSFNGATSSSTITVETDGSSSSYDKRAFLESVTTRGSGCQYKWSTSNTVGTIDSIQVTEAGTYSVTVTPPNGCAYVETWNVTLSPEIRVSYNTTVCDGDEFTLSANSYCSNSNYSFNPDCIFLWHGPGINGTHAGGDTPGITASIEEFGTNVLTYYLESRCNFSGLQKITYDTIVVTIKPRTQGTSDTASVCENYTWHDSTYVYPGTHYYVHPVENEDDCPQVDTLHLTINSPVIHISNPSPICAGDTITITPFVIGNGNITWSNGESSNSISVSPSENTTYTAVISNDIGCKDSASVTVNVVPRPDVQITNNEGTIIASDTSACGEMYLYATGASSYEWSWVQTTLTSPPTPIPGNDYGEYILVYAMYSPTTYSVEPTSYSVTVTGIADNNCTNKDSLLVWVFPAPSPEIYYRTICKNDLPYSWQDTIFDIGTHSGTFIFNKQNSYGCGYNIILNLTVVEPAVTIETINSNITTCAGGSINLHASATGNSDISYKWIFPDNSIHDGAYQDIVNATSTNTGIYTAIATVTQTANSVTCTATDTATVEVTVNTTVNQSITVDTCAVNYVWHCLDGQDTVIYGSGIYTHPHLDANQCMQVDTLRLNLTVIPTFSICNDTTIEAGSTALLSVSGAESYLYQWLPAETLLNPNSATPTASPLQSTYYHVIAYPIPSEEGNLVQNGDFELGYNYSFSTDYHYKEESELNGLSLGAGNFTITTDVQNVWSDEGHFYGYGDNGNYMIVDGMVSPDAVVWSQQINVEPHTLYNLSAQIASLKDSYRSAARLQFMVNEDVLGSVFNAPSTLYHWERFYDFWYSGDNNTATISILNQNTNHNGNDFGLDHIVFVPMRSCQTEDSVLVNVFYDIDTCDFYTWIDGETHTETGDYYYPHTDVFGNELVDTLFLTIRESSELIIPVTECDEYWWMDYDNITYTTDTIVPFIIPEGNAQGCDSVVILDLTIKHSSTGIDTQVACDRFEWIDGEIYTEDNNTATYTLWGDNADGCDSVVTLNLTINRSDTTLIDTIVCYSATGYDFNGQNYKKPGEYHPTANLQSSVTGCDSIVMLNLTILPENRDTIYADICKGDTFKINVGTIPLSFTETQAFGIQTPPDDNGCRGFLQIYITAHDSVQTHFYESLCYGETYNDNGFNITAADTTKSLYILHDTTQFGCDSTVYLHLKINPTYYDETVASTCVGTPYVWEGHSISIHTAPGTYTLWDSL